MLIPLEGNPGVRGAGSGSSRIVVTGATGLVGSALVPYLRSAGYEVMRLRRSTTRRAARHDPPGAAPPSAGRGATPQAIDLSWDPQAGTLDAAPLEGIRAAVHLAGENLASGRWTPREKERILRSRVDGTHLLATRLASLVHKPELLLCASAVGYYGDRGQQPVDEGGELGAGFLASVVQAWEEAAAPAVAAGIRVVHLRMGAILAAEGGALAKMLPLFRAGLGARLGSGRQFFSWIALDDVCRAAGWTIADPSLDGPVNATAPGAVTNREFTRVLGRVLGRRAPFAIPSWVLRAVLGEMAKETLLTGSRVHPARLLASGFTFAYPDLSPALRHLLRRNDG